MTELSMEKLVKSEPATGNGLNEIADKLVIIETLYILAASPASPRDVVSRLKSIFGFDSNEDQVVEVLGGLADRNLIRKFSNLPDQTLSLKLLSESFSITPLGLKKLGEWLESLSEITLTMQLGLNQRLVVAKEKLSTLD
ncbi:MAG TPA: hypothetical protein VED17_07825 [Nitrososphaerales archaeon]|nr:hypothetical protein [Nitrososphaerales archaeon]